MKKSPLKQIQNQDQAKQKQHQEEGMMKAGMSLLEENQRRKSWEKTQLDVKAIEPDSMILRKEIDKELRNSLKHAVALKGNFGLPAAYTRAYQYQVKLYQELTYEALINNDQQQYPTLKARITALAGTVQAVKDKISEFIEDHFGGDKSRLSRGVSQQQISFATQMYCDNPDLVITYASPADILLNQTDYYGNLVKADQQYAIVKDFYDNPVLINVLDGNKDCFMLNTIKCTEYMQFVNEIGKEAKEAAKQKTARKMPFERINYKMDSFFGYNDGTATPEQDQLVLMFAHDDGVLQDHNTFKRHLYEHPNLKNLNYGGFDFENMEAISDLGPGDKNYWHDNIDDFDRLKMLDAICNQDNPFFDIKLLRTLVKEYYTIIAENAWWKSMGYDQGRLDLMRLKQKELAKQRLKIKKAEASAEKRESFLFDGKVQKTGVKSKEEPKAQGLGKDILNEENPIK